MSGNCIGRLCEERKSLRKNPIYGFVARPAKNPDGTLNLMLWNCVIPGKANTPWEGGSYKIKLIFNDSYPNSSPSCVFDPPIFHVNVFEDGLVCISLLGEDWKPEITIKNILFGIQNFLNEPNVHNPASNKACIIYNRSQSEYNARIKEQAQKMKEAVIV